MSAIAEFFVEIFAYWMLCCGNEFPAMPCTSCGRVAN